MENAQTSSQIPIIVEDVGLFVLLENDALMGNANPANFAVIAAYIFRVTTKIADPVAMNAIFFNHA